MQVIDNRLVNCDQSLPQYRGGDMPSNFKDSQEAAFRRIVRNAIRKGPFTKGERDVTLALVNIWFYHENGPKGYIHPSRKMLAKRAGVSVRTVASTLSKLRAGGMILPVSSVKGGKAKATRYVVDISYLLTFCGADWVDELLRGHPKNCTVSGSKIARYARAKIAHCNNNVQSPLSQNGKPGGNEDV